MIKLIVMMLFISVMVIINHYDDNRDRNAAEMIVVDNVILTLKITHKSSFAF